MCWAYMLLAEARADNRSAAAAPHLCFAPNAGFVEYASWRPTLEALLAARMPWAFSSYAQVEVDAAGMQLWEAHGVPPSALRTEANPFRMPLDEARSIAGGALGFPWVPNGLLSWVELPEEELEVA